MGHRVAAEGHRVLICAPFGRDAASLASVLQAEGYDSCICSDLEAVAARLDEHTGVVLLTEEALRTRLSALEAVVESQPAWSDVPFLVLATSQRGRLRPAQTARDRLPGFLINSVLLERPLGRRSLVSAVASTMRARQKQFEMRDHLAELSAGREALAASEAELRLIADSLPVLIGFIDRDLVYRFANRAYLDWFGQDPEAVVGRSLAQIAGAEMLGPRMPYIRRALAGEPVRFETVWPTRDGSHRHAEVRYLPRRGASGEVDGFHAFVLDVTDRKQAEEELEARVAERTAALEAEMARRSQAEAALNQSQKMEAIGQLTSGIAHDFNNMLTGVTGGLDIIRRRIATGRVDDLDRFIDAASTSAQRAAALTARLLAFSRRQSLDPKPLDTGALLHSLQDLLRRTLPENIDLNVVADGDVPRALADANQLESALLNLTINARDAMPEGGRLTIEASAVALDEAYASTRPDVEPGSYVLIAVSDTGGGMPPEVLDRAFEPFFTTKPIGQGTGLGLSMVYGFARQSGGVVRIHSDPEQGTSVKLYLPVATGDVATLSAASTDTSAPGQGQRVLLVEDDDAVRLLVREILEELGYRSIEAANADAALPVLVSERRLDLLISDVGLPGLNGRQLAEIARQHRPDLPILFVTGYAANAAIRADFLGANMDMISKPFAIEDLSAKIVSMMASAAG